MESPRTRRSDRSRNSIGRCKAFGGGFAAPAFRGEEALMGKYFIAWLLGVPAGLLILIYVFTHLL